MNKVVIHILPGVAPFQLEAFKKDAERSVKGSLYLCGNATKEITKDELEALKKARPELVVSHIRVVKEVGKKGQPKAEPKKEQPKAEASGQENQEVIVKKEPEKKEQEESPAKKKDKKKKG